MCTRRSVAAPAYLQALSTRFNNTCSTAERLAKTRAPAADSRQPDGVIEVKHERFTGGDLLFEAGIETREDAFLDKDDIEVVDAIQIMTPLMPGCRERGQSSGLF